MEMPYTPTPDQEAFMREAVAAGRLSRPEDALREAMVVWEERERARAELLVTLDKAKYSLAQGRGRVITETSMRELADDVHRRGLTRLEAEQQRQLS